VRERDQEGRCCVRETRGMGSVRETPGGKGGVRDTGWLRVARAGSAEEKESRDSERCEMSERSITGVLENGLRKIFP
jgi:hypothetical protein